ncbi:hypothetical protein BH10PSE13_BH10PSE13_24470 [soil metagenome]
MHLPILPNRKSYEDVRTLIEMFGEDAGMEAANRADASRDLGNHIHFCHWRQIERMIVLLSVDRAFGTIN